MIIPVIFDVEDCDAPGHFGVPPIGCYATWEPCHKLLLSNYIFGVEYLGGDLETLSRVNANCTPFITKE